MKELLLVDFRRVLKDKLFLVICILAGVFALLTPLLYLLLFGGIEGVELLGVPVEAKTQFFSAFTVGNNLGIIVPVLLLIVIFKDFNQGTIRNKIISGKTREQIVLSNFIVIFTVLFGVILANAVLTFGVSLIFFPYSSEGFSFSELWSFLGGLGLEILLYLFVAAFLCWIISVMKNMGLVIVSYVAITMIMSIITSILQIAQSLLPVFQYDTAATVIEWIQNFNVFNFSMVIGMADYTAGQIVGCIVAPLVGAAGLFGWSVLKFRKKDLK